jgi:hypothetical protein
MDCNLMREPQSPRLDSEEKDSEQLMSGLDKHGVHTVRRRYRILVDKTFNGRGIDEA